MDIQELKDKKKTDVVKNQVAYQALIKRQLKVNGLDREKLAKDLNSGIKKIAKQITNNSLRLGMEWLSK